MSYTITRAILESLFGKDPLKFSSPVIGVGKSKHILKYNIEIADVSYRNISKILWQLRQSKIVEFHENSDGVKITLTESGKRRMLSYRLDDMAIKKSKSWDGSWHIVAFDIPENKKVARNALGQKMKSLGLLPFQRSLWIYPYNCRDEIDFIAEIFGVGRYVHYIVTRSITNDELLRKRFNVA